MRIEAARMKLVGQASLLLAMHCELEQEITRSTIPNEERVILLAHAQILGDLLARYADALYERHDQRSIILTGIVIDPLAARVAALRVELTVVRIGFILSYDEGRVTTLPDNAATAAARERLGVLRTRIDAARTEIDEIETGEALRRVSALVIPLIDGICATNDLMNELVEQASSTAQSAP